MAEYTVGALLCWHVAALEARAAEHGTIKPTHLFIGLCAACEMSFEDIMTAVGEGASLDQVPAVQTQLEELRRVFLKAGVDVKATRRRLREVMGKEGMVPPDGVMHRDEKTKGFFARGEAIAVGTDGKILRPVHLLWALCEDTEQPWNAVMSELGASHAELLETAEMAGRSATPADIPVDVPAGSAHEPLGGKTRRDSKTPLLDRFGRDITALARDGKLTPTIGRKTEILRLGQVLLQRLMRNAILVGDAGVGKTCIVEGLAQRLAGDDVTYEPLKNKRIIEISAASLVMGTKYRGEFEERLQGIIAEVTADPNIILFIDEFHTLMGAGAAGDGNMDAADILKPVLSRGDIQCIGATTTREYRRYIEKDTAFQSRFEVVWVEEPIHDDAIEILRGWRETIEAHYSLKISDEALEAAVRMSVRYLTDQRLPRKAMNLIDRACSRAILDTFSAAGASAMIGRLQIARVVANETGIPIEQIIGETDHEGGGEQRLLQMEAVLHQRVKGQDEAVTAVSEAIRTARAGLKDPNRPLGVFLFLGPTGTGKTELAKALAEFLFGSEDRIVRLDMSEFAERHTTARLIGSPPGYVGYDEEGQLTGPIRTHPYSVVLLDEIEKASPEVHQLFLQVFDDGRLTDAKGNPVSFREAIIIMTSNLGVSIPRGIGFDTGDTGADMAALRERTLEEVRKVLRPELRNRIQRTVVFDPLTRPVIREIIDKIVGNVMARIAHRGITMTLDDSAYELLMQEGFDESYGARCKRKRNNSGRSSSRARSLAYCHHSISVSRDANASTGRCGCVCFSVSASDSQVARGQSRSASTARNGSVCAWLMSSGSERATTTTMGG